MYEWITRFVFCTQLTTNAFCNRNIQCTFNSQLQSALINAGFGKFHFFLLTVCGMIYMNTAIGITIISFVLPSATCDFRMSSSDKGLLTAAPMLGMYYSTPMRYRWSAWICPKTASYFVCSLSLLGMLFGSYFWGCLADTKGRKVVLVATLLLDGFCGLLSSIAQYYSLFMLFRFFNGFGWVAICIFTSSTSYLNRDSLFVLHVLIQSITASLVQWAFASHI